MSLQLFGTALLSFIAGAGIGLALGKRIWGQKWWGHTSEGIDREWMRRKF